jgi:hypothetical protein
MEGKAIFTVGDPCGGVLAAPRNPRLPPPRAGRSWKPQMARIKHTPALPRTLASAAQTRVIMCCNHCWRQANPDAAEMADRFGTDTTIRD